MSLTHRIPTQSSLVLLFFLTVARAGLPEILPTDSLQAQPDSLIGSSEDTVIAELHAEAQENEFQNEMNALFDFDSLGIDTTGWCTKRINVARFNYKSLVDTMRIALVDSQQNRWYVHPAKGQVTSPFGRRRAFWHYGIDLKVKTGDTILCAFDGIVRVVQYDRYGYGKVVVVRHSNGLETLYGHLSASAISVNQRLKAGDVIGLGGNTGRSTGSHLHFEMRYCGEPFDPTCIVDFENYGLKSDTLVVTRGNFEYIAEARSAVYHRIRRGDTLGRIARRYGTSVRKICALNGISSKKRLRIGYRLVVKRDTTPDQLTLHSGLPSEAL